jgi:hypothetical protein
VIASFFVFLNTKSAHGLRYLSRIQFATDRSSQDIERQTRTLVTSGKENARETGYVIDSATEARRRL